MIINHYKSKKYYGKKRLMRINKFIAQCGIASRRKAEDLILSGKIKVNGKVITDLSTDIKDTDIVSYDNKNIRMVSNYVYYKLNKPKGYITSTTDDKDRKTVMDLMRGVHFRVFPIGRLDYDTEGLILLTNDGDVANILTKPNSEVKKTYIVHIDNEINGDEIKQLSKGVDIGDYITKPCSVELIESTNNVSKLKLTITEGKNRQIRKMFSTIGKNVTFLRRIQIGEIKLGGLSRGEYAPLNQKEIRYLKSLKK